MIFVLGVATGVILTIGAILIWWYWGAKVVTGILEDDEAMSRYGNKERQMGSSQET